MARPVPRRPYRHGLSLLIALVALFGQFTVAFAPLAEGREARMASHVESHGAVGHFSHDETKCVSCQARSMVATTDRPAAPAIEPAINCGCEVVRDSRAVSSVAHLQSSPRAPPFVI
jgi:hypothetical protein